MKFLAATALSLAMSSPVFAQEDERGSAVRADPAMARAMADVSAVSPALARYTTDTVLDQLWSRPGLSRRDRSIVTLSALIARNQVVEMPYHFNLALDNGVTPAEISEIITHLAFYAGWGNAMSALGQAREVFAARGVTADQLPPAEPPLLPIDAAAEAARSSAVQASTGPVSQSLVDLTTDVLFKDLWLRPDLAPRDRSLATVSALIAGGQVAQMPFHLNRAMDNGLTRNQASEVVSHLAFYAGWPNAMSAVPVMKDVFDKRPD